MDRKKTYFVSDFHLGVDAKLTSREREQKIVTWISSIQDEMAALYLVGDVFDHWFEYGTVIPKGFSRILGKLAELRDQNIPVYFFTGNHDMWMFNYLKDEMNIPIYRSPREITVGGKRILVGHGDGLGPGDLKYKFIKSIFSNKFCQWAFARLHPNFGIWLMKKYSRISRNSKSDDNIFLGPENEWLVSFCEEKLKENHYDYFVFGHRHLPIFYALSNQKSTYINLGDWLYYESFLVIDDENAILRTTEDSSPIKTIWPNPTQN